MTHKFVGDTPPGLIYYRIRARSESPLGLAKLVPSGNVRSPETISNIETVGDCRRFYF